MCIFFSQLFVTMMVTSMCVNGAEEFWEVALNPQPNQSSPMVFQITLSSSFYLKTGTISVSNIHIYFHSHTLYLPQNQVLYSTVCSSVIVFFFQKNFNQNVWTWFGKLTWNIYIAVNCRGFIGASVVPSANVGESWGSAAYQWTRELYTRWQADHRGSTRGMYCTVLALIHEVC